MTRCRCGYAGRFVFSLWMSTVNVYVRFAIKRNLAEKKKIYLEKHPTGVLLLTGLPPPNILL